MKPAGRLKPVYCQGLNGRHEETRTPDLYRVNYGPPRNSLILEASAAPKNIQSHPKFHFSTVNRTVKIGEGLSVS